MKKSHLEIIARDLFEIDAERYPDEICLREAIDWLCRAQDASSCGGVSAGYYFKTGWKPPYPETTGYIICSFLDYWHLIKRGDYMDRAIKMGDWEIEVQLPSGAVRQGVGINDEPRIFNTGQVILGWSSLYSHTGQVRFLEAAVRATDWLVENQDDDGKWSRYAYMNTATTYHTMVAWAILRMYALTRDEKYKASARKHILWVLAYAKDNGWLDRSSFTVNRPPFTHTIGYALQGLIESAVYLEDIKPDILTLVQKACNSMMLRYELNKPNPYSFPRYLPATLDEKWMSQDKYSCITGNLQIAIVWLKMYEINNDARLLNAALKIIDQCKAVQALDSKDSGIVGGIPGSKPIWGRYQSYGYPNWAAKFFVDAIMLQESVIAKLRDEK